MTIIADLHTHTLASPHAYSTIDEMCDQASELGLKAIAITDHGPALPDSPHVWHIRSLRSLPRRVRGVFLLRGVEANVMDAAGTLDVEVEKLDFVIASMHSVVIDPLDRERHTAAWLACCDNPLIDCLGHVGSPEFDFDHEAVVRRCAQTGTLIEINSSSPKVRAGSLENCRDVARLCMQYGVPVVVNSDAHNRWAVGNFTEALSILDRLDFPGELVLNADYERLRNYFLTRKSLDIGG